MRKKSVVTNFNHDSCLLVLYTHLGCWKSYHIATSYSIMELEGKDKRLDGEYNAANPLQKPSKRENAIQKCYEVARDRGYNYFGVNNGGLCVGSFDAEFRYKVYGKHTICKDGKGGQWANDVYFILRESSKLLENKLA